MKTKIFIGLLFMFLLSMPDIIAQNYDHRDRDNDDQRRDRPAYPDWKDKRNDDIETRRILKDIEARLENLEASLPARMRNSDRQEIHRQIADILNEMEGLYPKEEAKRPMVMSDNEFRGLIIAISKEPFSRGKQQIINSSADHYFFSLDQLIKVLAQFSFDDEKLNIVKVLYPKVLDQNRNYLLYDSFTFSSSKEKLGDYLNSFPKEGPQQ